VKISRCSRHTRDEGWHLRTGHIPDICRYSTGGCL